MHDYKNGLLKAHLHLQVDGGSDARGFVVVQLLALFVSLGIVERVTIASLIPGHTHEDIDAFFSRLWKSLKTGAGVRSHRSWAEIMDCARSVYPGWCNLTLGKIEASAVSTIPFVWRFQELFGQGPGHAARPCLSPRMKGLFGKGKDHALKPSKFVIEVGPDQLPTITAFLSSVPGAAIYGAFDRVPVFRFAPRLEGLAVHDLAIGWHIQHAALVQALASGDPLEAGYTAEHVREIATMECAFTAPPEDAFGPAIHARFQALVDLGFAPLKDVRLERVPRAARGAQRGARAGHQKKDKSSDSDDWDEGDVPNEEEDEIEAGELEEEEEGGEESVVGADDVQYEIEDWLDRRFNSKDQCNEYFIKFVGWPDPEWTLERRLNSRVPQKVDDNFNRRDNAAKAAARSARKAAAWRAAARGGGVIVDEEDDNDDDSAGGVDVQGERQSASKKQRRSKRNKEKKS